MELDEGVTGEFGKVCHVKKQRRKRQKLLIIDLFFDFAKNTTLHGLRYITQVGLTAVEKVFWVLTFLISVVLCFILIERVWHKWWYSPVIVSFNERMIPVGEVPFPSITICPQWKCKTSAYNYTDQYMKFGKRRYNTKEHDETYENKTMLEDAFLICDQSHYYILKDRTTADESLVQNIMTVSPDPTDVIESCLWRGKPCNTFFKEVLTSEGVCFNFNALSHKDIFKEKSIQNKYKYLYADTPTNKWTIDTGYASPNSRKNKKTQKGGKNKTTRKVEEEDAELEEYPRRGQENGASPDLNIILKENSEDSDDLCNSLSNGWKIYLQHPADMPQASLYYYAAIPDQVTSLALKFSVLNTSESLMNYRSDQRQCYFPKDRPLKYFATYTPDNCRLECLSIFTYKRCKCVWYHMPHSNSSEICTAKKRKCVRNAQDELASNRLQMDDCNCLPSCESIHYDAEILKTNFDVKKYKKAVKRVYNTSFGENSNFSRLEIYFKEPRYVSMRRSELFGLTDFLANCGGLLGLFLGFSFLSLVEMFYFITLRIDESIPEELGMVCHKMKQRRKRQKVLIIDLFCDFAKNTTLHGLRYITEVGLTVVEKVFWVLTFLISVVLCFFLIQRVWHKWWYSPVIVSFSERMIPVGEVPFPSVTICPQWKSKTSAYNYTDQYLKFGKRHYSREEYDETYENKTLLEDAFLVCDRNGYFVLKDRTSANESLVQNLMMVAPDPTDVIDFCLWRGKPCENFFKVALTSEGVCFNFNGLSYKEIFREKSIQNQYKYLYADTPTNKWTDSQKNKKRNQKGEKNKTKINEDNIELEEYPRRGRENSAYPDLIVVLKENYGDGDDLCNSLSNGWKIYLHHPADLPQASLYYYGVIPDQVTSLVLKFSVLNTSESLMNYRSDQRQCFFPKDRPLKYFATYTPDNCRLECLSIFTYKRCKCVWYHMPHSNSSEICTAKKRKCVRNAQDELVSDRLIRDDCNCLPSCESINYDADILKTNFDVQKYVKAMKKVSNTSFSENHKFARLEIYFKEPRYVAMLRSELFGLTDFLANCGGLLGLFLGFSFLSLIEMFYFITLRLWCTLKRDIKIEKRHLKESIYKK